MDNVESLSKQKEVLMRNEASYENSVLPLFCFAFVACHA